ncbi:hypothetical protein SRABI36_04125 [Pedobacter sp. Bi36]|nr:hypothetical protein SRABI126_00913 [Pedobacter sp. Bi126]CAH0284807.1 hypothetical protein SRABI36_04125 [Pedobacter sp. Bi36]
MSAFYGTFNMEMIPLDAIDVSELAQQFIKEDRISIQNKCNFSQLFDRTETEDKKFLQIIIEDKIYNIADDHYPLDIDIDLTNPKNNIKIVYYVFINPNSNWQGIISGQLLQLKSYGILSEADLYIHVTDCFNLLPKVKSLIKEIAPSAVISSNDKNLFEYPGIKLIHDLALQFPKDNFIYLHTKGMAHNMHSRSTEEISLLANTFENWRKNLQLLNKNGIHKIGLFPAILKENKENNGYAGGWIWYNYWYASGEYLSNCPSPAQTTDRYYYEGWLSLQNQNPLIKPADCLSLYRIKNMSKNYFSPTEADFHLNFISRQRLHLTKRILQLFGSPRLAHYYYKTASHLKNILGRK